MRAIWAGACARSPGNGEANEVPPAHRRAACVCHDRPDYHAAHGPAGRQFSLRASPLPRQGAMFVLPRLGCRWIRRAAIQWRRCEPTAKLLEPRSACRGDLVRPAGNANASLQRARLHRPALLWCDRSRTGRTTTLPPPTTTLQKREVEAIADYLLAKLVGRGAVTREDCEEMFGKVPAPAANTRLSGKLDEERRLYWDFAATSTTRTGYSKLHLGT